MGDNWKKLKNRYEEANVIIFISQMFVNAIMTGLLKI